ncbi:uncharacterized protein PADG_02364 [Paracoccidioides brasiliensis Pb18]|uniref:Uncharacterized protein n=1 Tax=Paracoccidioides brasiliensis (strain Pb18) TaxID=502780 RepID=C1G2J8_PARBD|nr:uncharacterized protein PADG_02364 [Paracoccidioides brasiliensis Pb18]EEH46214.2 hypothetical protein PADG_02364 [Paracoccidioides brasiliensis Pb18]
MPVPFSISISNWGTDVQSPKAAILSKTELFPPVIMGSEPIRYLKRFSECHQVASGSANTLNHLTSIIHTGMVISVTNKWMLLGLFQSEKAPKIWAFIE